MSQEDPIVIVSYARTPIGAFQGTLGTTKATELGATAIKSCIDKANLDINSVEQVIMGCVLPAGLGQAPARQAALGAGLNKNTCCTTINKMCGSGMQAIIMAHDLLKAGTAEVVIAGGMENMSLAPYITPKARSGLRMGHATLLDHMFTDGLEDAYEGKLMGVYADKTAEKYGFTREQQDEFAISSLEKSLSASRDGKFKEEIAAVTVKSRKGETTIDSDEVPTKVNADKIPTLRPAFAKDGTVTAANASSISDGAAAVLLMKESKAKELGLKPKARLLSHATFAHDPSWFTTAPVGAMKNLFENTGWTKSDVDLFEINEAFAVVTMAACHDLELDQDKVNIHGGACALGHPVGATGARITATLISALEQTGGKKGIASLCIGGGEATAIAIERI